MVGPSEMRNIVNKKDFSPLSLIKSLTKIREMLVCWSMHDKELGKTGSDFYQCALFVG